MAAPRLAPPTTAPSNSASAQTAPSPRRRLPNPAAARNPSPAGPSAAQSISKSPSVAIRCSPFPVRPVSHSRPARARLPAPSMVPNRAIWEPGKRPVSLAAQVRARHPAAKPAPARPQARVPVEAPAPDQAQARAQEMAAAVAARPSTALLRRPPADRTAAPDLAFASTRIRASAHVPTVAFNAVSPAFKTVWTRMNS